MKTSGGPRLYQEGCSLAFLSVKKNLTKLLGIFKREKCSHQSHASKNPGVVLFSLVSESKLLYAHINTGWQIHPAPSGLMTREERTKNPLWHHTSPTSPKLLLCLLEVATERGAAFFGVMGQSWCHFSFQRCNRNILNQ